MTSSTGSTMAASSADLATPAQAVDNMPDDIIDRFVYIYQKLNKDNLQLLPHIYSEQVRFSDPLHKIAGLSSLSEYFHSLYQNVESIDFVIHDVVRDSNRAALKWTMNLVHPKLNSGNVFSVEGVSLLTYSDKVSLHQDYFDLGAMLYEQLPFVGGLIGFVKSRVGK
ncbi:nuclear transport factor 2 family protein [Shewanella youngdeokensis]|uniref:Nuclear transport factor 2 family protein n=1 Tax=Shewanella youngdeokensis TaxID=2999068 RepID=A0ABZ0K021_9GAMM|nr:nuclear transport factor 2 family protein [Shewanella sp. DAU334]